MSTPTLDDDAAYALLGEAWQAQDPGALATGTLTLPVAWCARLARALSAGRAPVQRLDLRAADGALHVACVVATPLGVLEAQAAVVPERVRLGPDERRVELRLVAPLRVTGGGALAGLARLMGGSPEVLAWRALAAQPGVTVAGDRVAVDLARWPRAEALCQRPWLGRPLCHYVQVTGCTVRADALVVQLRTGLGSPAP